LTTEAAVYGTEEEEGNNGGWWVGEKAAGDWASNETQDFTDEGGAGFLKEAGVRLVFVPLLPSLCQPARG
jgi:hypothetical protein